ACIRRAGGGHLGAANRQGAGRRLRDDGRGRIAGGDDVGAARERAVERCARYQPARHRRALLRYLRNVGRALHQYRVDRTAILCRFASCAWPEDDAEFDAQLDEARWPELKRRIAARIAERTRDEWCAVMAGSDICFAPVLSMAEAPSHPHNI